MESTNNNQNLLDGESTHQADNDQPLRNQQLDGIIRLLEKGQSVPRKRRIYNWIGALLCTILGGLVVGIILLSCENDIRDSRSIVGRNISEQDDKVITRTKVKTSGILTFEGVPIYVYSKGKIYAVKPVLHELKDSLSVVNTSPYTATVLLKESVGDYLDLRIEASGVSTVSASSPQVKFKWR